MRRRIEEQLSMIEEWVRQAEKALKNKPEGSLIVTQRCAKTEWYIQTGNDYRYLPKTKERLARAMAQASYTKAFLRQAEKERRVLERLHELKAERSAGVMFRNLAKPYEALSRGRKELVRPYVLPDEDYAKAWEAVPYHGKGFSENAPEIYSERGERVRSKSEKMIADKLYYMGVHYRYECPVALRGVGTIFSDFTLLDLTERAEVVLEHFGLMDDPEYMKNAFWKIDVFGKNGFRLGEDFLCTFEAQNHSIDMKGFEKMISERFSED